MSMSNHERNQFELLSQMFASGDPKLAKQIDRRSKASEMTLIPAADVRLMAMGGIILSLLMSVATFLVPVNAWFPVASIVLAMVSLKLVRKYGPVTQETSRSEYSES